MVVDEVTARPDIEAWLTECRVAWEFDPALPVDTVDQVGSLANQARLEPLDADVVDRYAADMERGDQFPPVIVRRQGKRLILLGGNHRLAGAKQAKRETLPAYVVTCEPEMATRLMYEDNRRHGLPPSEAERLHQAVHLIETGYTQKQAAQTVGVSASKLDVALGAARADRRAQLLGIKGWENLPKSSRWRLGGLRSDPAFQALAQLAVDTNMGNGEVGMLVTRVNNARSDTDALEIVGMESEARAHLAQRKAGGMIRRKAPPHATLGGHLAGIASLDPSDVAASCTSADQRATLRRRIGDTVKRLNAIAGQL
jgi:uncharacterized ParB-like nuclease family protein